MLVGHGAAKANLRLPSLTINRSKPLNSMINFRFTIFVAAVLALHSVNGETGQAGDAPWRPSYHFTAHAGWINDPIRPVFSGEQYIMAFERNGGNRAVWGDMTWGTATSTDLLNWTQRHDALMPGPLGYDREGIFTGSMVTVSADYESPEPGSQRIAAVYTGAASLPIHWDLPYRPGEETQNLAIHDFSGGSGVFSKDESNPKIPHPPAALWPSGSSVPSASECPGPRPHIDPLEVTGFRDPLVDWVSTAGGQGGGHWRMLLAGGVRSWGGAVFQFQSRDLKSWDYVGPLLSCGVYPGLGWNFECASEFAIGSDSVNRYVLVGVEPADNRRNRTARWLRGAATSGGRVAASADGWVDHGNLYAVTSFVDAKGRRVVMGWIDEDRSLADASWAGCLSLPRQVTADPWGWQVLAFSPLPELMEARTWHSSMTTDLLDAARSAQGAWLPLSSVHDGVEVVPSQIEVLLGADFESCLSTPGGCGMQLKLLVSSDDAIFTALSIRAVRNVSDSNVADVTVVIDRTKSSPLCDSGAVHCFDEHGMYSQPINAGLNIRLFVDTSVIEVFAGEGVLVLTGRVYPGDLSSVAKRVWVGPMADGTAAASVPTLSSTDVWGIDLKAMHGLAPSSSGLQDDDDAAITRGDYTLLVALAIALVVGLIVAGVVWMHRRAKAEHRQELLDNADESAARLSDNW